MNALHADVTDYLATRRAMGFKVEGLSKLLFSFIGFCEARGAIRVHNDLALEWATAQIKVPVSDALVARRLDAVRLSPGISTRWTRPPKSPPKRWAADDIGPRSQTCSARTRSSR